jgi:excisionase family DNA binding protein
MPRSNTLRSVAYQTVKPTCSPAPDANVAPKPLGKLLTANEVAERLRCHVSTVYDLVRGGRLRGLSLTGELGTSRRGKKGLRVPEVFLDEFLEAALVRVNPPRAEQEPPPSLPPVKPAGRSRSRSWVMLPPPPSGKR